MRNGLTAFYAAYSDLPPLSGGHRLSDLEMVGFVSHVWFRFDVEFSGGFCLSPIADKP